jgi:hypothetical protein
MTAPEENAEEGQPVEGTEAEDRTDWKAEARKWENRAKDNAAAAKRIKELEAERDAANRTEVEKAREAGKAEALATVLKDRALDKVEAKAARLFADPEDARALLADKVDDFIDGDKVDGKAIDDALADLLKRKPHLGADTRRFKGGGDGGAREGAKPDMLSRSDVEKLFRDGKHAEIAKARAEGRITYDKRPTTS